MWRAPLQVWRPSHGECTAVRDSLDTPWQVAVQVARLIDPCTLKHLVSDEGACWSGAELRYSLQRRRPWVRALLLRRNDAPNHEQCADQAHGRSWLVALCTFAARLSAAWLEILPTRAGEHQTDYRLRDRFTTSASPTLARRWGIRHLYIRAIERVVAVHPIA